MSKKKARKYKRVSSDQSGRRRKRLEKVQHVGDLRAYVQPKMQLLKAVGAMLRLIKIHCSDLQS